MPNQTLLVSWRKRWNRSLLQFLGRRVRVTVDIEDLAQETWMRLLRARDLRDVRHPQAYLLRVASHVVAEWRENHPPAESLSAVDDDFLVDDSTPEFEFRAGISQQRLNEVLESATPAMRAVLLLKLRDERPCKEIACELGMTDRQVKRYLARGYERLRQVLES